MIKDYYNVLVKTQIVLQKIGPKGPLKERKRKHYVSMTDVTPLT